MWNFSKRRAPEEPKKFVCVRSSVEPERIGFNEWQEFLRQQRESYKPFCYVRKKFCND